MTPLGGIALGLLLVLLDLRPGGLDVLPDVLGWLLVVRGLSLLLPRCPRLSPARTAAVAAGVLSLADLVHPTVTTSDGTSTTSAVVSPEGLQGVLSFGSAVAAVVVAVLLSLRLRELAGHAGDDARARVFGRFAAYHAVVGVALLLLWLAGLIAAPDGPDDVQGPAAGLALLVVLLVLLVEVVFLLTLRGARLEPWALPERAATAPPVTSGGPGD